MEKITLNKIIGKPISGEWGSENGEIKVLRTTNFTNSGVIDYKEVVLRDISEKKIEKKKLRKGDVIIEKSGGSPTQPVGRVVYFEKEELFLCNNFTAALRVKVDWCHSKYLHYILYANHLFGITNYFQNKTTGIINLQLNRYIDSIKIPVPKSDLQNKTTKIQDQIVEVLDRAVALRDKTKRLLDEYDLLAQSVFLEMFGDPVNNDKEWSLDILKNVTTKIGSGSTPRGGKNSYKKEGISLIRSLNIHDNLFKYKDLAFIDEKQAEKLKNVSLKKEDVLINITGASVARSAIVPNEVLPARVNQHVSILRCNQKKINSIFLLHNIISPNSKRKLLGVSTNGGATREAITKSELEDLEVILPPIDLQTQFAQKIELIEKQKEIAQQELQEAEDLFQALLQKAFKGELVSTIPEKV